VGRVPPHIGIEAVTARLVAAGCVAAEEEAEELVTAARDERTLEAWLRRREQGEPLPWIIGTMQFCGHQLHVDPGVYVPRLQSEELARHAAALLPAGGRAVDLCAGAGAIAVHLMASVPTADVLGVDVDPRAVACARRNGVLAQVGDLGDRLPSGSFDLVVAVAPYVPTAELRLLPADVMRYEPRVALEGGGDGLDIVRRLVDDAARLLRPGGWLATELGGPQEQLLAPSLAADGFAPATVWHDEDGDLRGLAAQLGGAAPRG
jgi:release factor glutamine methyltransferase